MEGCGSKEELKKNETEALRSDMNEIWTFLGPKLPVCVWTEEEH